jgi:hypothetical protein
MILPQVALSVDHTHAHSTTHRLAYSAVLEVPQAAAGRARSQDILHRPHKLSSSVYDAAIPQQRASPSKESQELHPSQ